MRTFRSRRTIAAAVLALVAGAVFAQGTCVVRDPDLQSRYEGPCVNGLAEGAGRASGPAASYEGGFRAGMKHGHGAKRWTVTGDEYSGDWADDVRHGRGVYRWGPRTAWAGEYYEGEYRNDKRHGQGSYTWSTGDRYTGPFEDDKQAGLQTPRQQQRIRASKARLAVIGKPGALVCGTTAVGIAYRQPMQSEVVEVVDDRLMLRPRRIGDAPAPADAPTFWDLAANWNPCRN